MLTVTYGPAPGIFSYLFRCVTRFTIMCRICIEIWAYIIFLRTIDTSNEDKPIEDKPIEVGNSHAIQLGMEERHRERLACVVDHSQEALAPTKSDFA